MASPTDRSPGERNLLLRSLSPATLQRLTPHLEGVALSVDAVLCERGEESEFVHFPDSALVSLIALMTDGSAVEVGVVGRDGMCGLDVVLSSDHAMARAMVQVGGGAQRISSERLVPLLEQSSDLRVQLKRYAQAFLTQVAQSAACNASHSVDERCARWLLLTQDRLDTSTLPLKQEFLAMMLGVRRAGVSAAAAALQRAKIIRYRRGNIVILDRERLEAASCECYGVVTTAYQRLIGEDMTFLPLVAA